MEENLKKLLLTDLSARLPYGVMIEGLEHPEVMTIKHLAIVSVMTAEPYKPYLRPMSSMTEEEKTELFRLMGNGTDIQRIDFYLSHYFDYRGLIEKGLAIEAPKGMYND